MQTDSNILDFVEYKSHLSLDEVAKVCYDIRQDWILNQQRRKKEQERKEHNDRILHSVRYA